MLIETFLVISQLPIEVSSFPLLGKSVITHFNKASLLFYSFLQASKDHMYKMVSPHFCWNYIFLDLGFPMVG